MPLVLDEAENIVERMKKMRIAEGCPWDAFGILVRTNSQARVIGETLMKAGLPYRTSGGPSFCQRKGVRDMLAYLKAAANMDDDMNVLRIINVPRHRQNGARVRCCFHPRLRYRRGIVRSSDQAAAEFSSWTEPPH